MTWRYTDDSKVVVMSEDGRISCLASSLQVGIPILNPPVKNPSLDDYKQAIEAMLQAHAVSLDYITWDRLLSHVNSPDPAWRADGLRAWQWKTAIDQKAYAILSEVQTGKRPLPSVAEFLALLPRPLA